MAHLRTALVAATLAVTATVTRPAEATDIQACIHASENGQRARNSGKLREARDSFVVCGAESCPAVIRKDCSQWSSELSATLPTVVFGARDKQGHDLLDVTVSMDDEIIVKNLDGKSVTVDPGAHTFKFERKGSAPVTQKALIKEGEKTRSLSVVFDSDSSTTGSSDPGGPAKDPPIGGDATSSKSGHTPYPWIVVGVGGAAAVAGVIILATAPDRPAGCDGETKTCVRIADESETQFQDRQQEAGRADSQPVLGLVVLGAGLLVAAGGVVWHFLEGTDAKAKVARPGGGGLRVTPWTSPQASGVTLGGTF